MTYHEDRWADIEAMLSSGGGSLGRQKGMPVLRHERGVFWFKPVGTGLADASTAVDAATGAYNDPATYATTGQDDVFIYLGGAYDFNGSVNGWEGTITVMAAHGVGYATSFVNSNVGALYVFRITVNNVELGSFSVAEATNTVEGISIINTGATFVHNIFFSNTMENGISYLNASNQLLVSDCWFSNMTNDGIECTGSGAMIYNCHFTNIGDNAIHINGALANVAVVYKNHIAGAATTDYGINVALANNCSITDNFIGDCTTGLRVDTGTANTWEGNYGTFESDFTTAIGAGVSDLFGTAVAHKYPLNTSGVVRLYPYLVNMAAGDTVEMVILRKNDGANSGVVTTITWTGAQTEICPSYEFNYTETRTIYVTIQRTAGVIVDLDVGIEEAIK